MGRNGLMPSGLGLHRWIGLEIDPMEQLEAAKRRLPPIATFSGFTAAWLHGIDVPPCDPIEATLPKQAGVSARAGIAIRRSPLSDVDVVEVRGMRVTSKVRTVTELCSRLSLVDAVVIADAALHNHHVRLEQLSAWATTNGGRRGIKRLRRVLTLAEPSAESPMESRLRMVLVLGGLPRPKAQVPIKDGAGRFVGRPDLYYEEQRLGIEYDGGMHRDALAEDNRRQNRLLHAGVHLLRFTAGDVLGHPQVVLSQVRAMLTSAGTIGVASTLKRSSAGTRGRWTA